MAENDQDVSINFISESILLLRGQKVMLDFSIAELYGVQTKALNQAVRRNRERFPEDFMFQLSKREVGALRSQLVTLKQDGNTNCLPYAFTEQGVAMLSSVLRGPKAVTLNIEIMRTFCVVSEFYCG